MFRKAEQKYLKDVVKVLRDSILSERKEFIVDLKELAKKINLKQRDHIIDLIRKWENKDD